MSPGPAPAPSTARSVFLRGFVARFSCYNAKNTTELYRAYCTSTVSPAQQAVLAALLRRSACPQALALRVRIILGAAVGQRNEPLARQLVQRARNSSVVFLAL